MKFINLKKKKTSMHSKLLLYMFTLVLVVVMFIAVGLFFVGQFSTTTKKYSSNLTFQNEFYTRQIEKYFDDLSMMTEMLANDSSAIIDNYLNENGIHISALNDSQYYTEGVQEALLPKLEEELLKADASGAFIILNATVNTGEANSDKSKTGLYFQRSTLDRTDETLLLFRRNAELGRKKDIMPHRKWRLEFRNDFVPQTENFFNETIVKEKKSVLTDIFTLNGTSEKAMAFITSLFGADGSYYGICGFEISNNYFKDFFVQPTRLEQLTCTFSKTEKDGKIDCENIFWTGVLNGYSLKPSGTLVPKKMNDSLTEFLGENTFVAAKNEITILNTPYTLVVMQPKSEFDKTVAINVTKIVLVCFLLIISAVVLCIFFSRKFVSPVIKSLEKIRMQEHARTKSDIIEIDDLFVYLAEQDRLRDLEMKNLKHQNEELTIVTENQTSEIDKRQTEIERLAYSRKNEIDPDNYEAFKIGLKELTKTEKTVFNLYLQGKTAKEITDILNIRESTLKFHNHNILEKLCVSSRKQMLRYATLLKQEYLNQ
ncbi:transcriptional regulator LuxR family [Coprobacillus sp. CAG:698]|nr:transcriptional regulator LuxR family [Coprobacillus sp. CAG:698]